MFPAEFNFCITPYYYVYAATIKYLNKNQLLEVVTGLFKLYIYLISTLLFLLILPPVFVLFF